MDSTPNLWSAEEAFRYVWASMKREDTDSLNQEVLKGLFRWSLAVVGFAAIATLAQ